MNSDSPNRPRSRSPRRDAWGWFRAPLAPAANASGRRRRTLAWLLVSLFLLTVGTVLLVMLVDAPGSARRAAYVPFNLGLMVLVVLAYAMNSAGHYRWAASITVLAAALGPWVSFVLDPSIRRGDFVPLGYAIVSVLLSSILLSPLVTILVAAGQILGLSLVALASPAGNPIDWPSFLVLVFSTSMLSILFSIISRGDLQQIDVQTRVLAQSEAELRELSVRDHLTGLFNRRYLEESLEREIRRSVRSGQTIGLILVDVDQFKDVNDAWGHAAGDLLLGELGQLFKSQVRGGDIACRYGGDEFVIVLPEASRQATRQRAERLRKAVNGLRLEYHGHPLYPITMSAGVAIYPQHASSGAALLKAADAALYRAKDAGRDCVMLATRRRALISR